MKAKKDDGCPCPKKKCERHGNCVPCTDFHAAKKRNKLPYCKR